MSALTTLRDSALRRRDAIENTDEDEKTLLGQAIHTALTPVRVATSRPAIKAYLTTILFLLTSFVLLSFSTTAYFLFYYNFIPQIGLSQTVFLQYDANAHPHATIALDTSALISQQPYDISVSLLMPRTPSNLAAGNFMVDLSLLADPTASSGPLSYLFNGSSIPSTGTQLARSRRSAILPYTSHVTSLSHKLLHLPIHLLSFKDLDASELKVSLFEHLSFQRGRSKVPTTAYLEIQSQTPPSGCPPPSQPTIGLHLLSNPSPATSSTLQIYSAQIHFHARFEGLRYYIYNYRVLSFLVFSSLFYMSAIISMATAWAFISALISARNPQSTLTSGGQGGKVNRIKNEESSTSAQVKSEDADSRRLQDVKAEEDLDSDVDSQNLANLSGTERTFPTVGRNAQPLRYTPATSTTAPSDGAENVWAEQRDDATHDAEDEEDDLDGDDGTRGRVLTPLSGATQDIKEEDDDDDTFRGDSGIGTSMESEARSSASGLVRRRSSRGGSGSRGSASRR